MIIQYQLLERAINIVLVLERYRSKALTILSLKAQQVATFRLPKKHIFIQYKTIAGFGKQTLVIAFDTELKLYSLNGTELSSFQDHMKTITSIWVVYLVPPTTTHLCAVIISSTKLKGNIYFFAGSFSCCDIILRPLTSCVYLEK